MCEMGYGVGVILRADEMKPVVYFETARTSPIPNIKWLMDIMYRVVFCNDASHPGCSCSRPTCNKDWFSG